MGDPLPDEAAFRARQPPPWQTPQGLEAVLAAWRDNRKIGRCLTLDEALPGNPARQQPLPPSLHPRLTGALAARGITQLFSHQAQVYALAQAGRHAVVSTPTASGKSLCYNLPVLDALARDSAARALYLFPTKALTRDQEEALKALMRDAGLDQGALTYDGDTPADARRAARGRSGVLLTNPDMLHAGILPHHASWARLFSNLRFVVIDELHTYRGVFGSHLANVVRRLLRIARFHGSSPRLLFASATIGNPQEHASNVAGAEVVHVGESGAPTGPRHVLLYNPPVVNAELGVRESYLKAAVKLARDLVRAQVPTLVFAQGRSQVETALKYLRDRLAAERIAPEQIVGYRGGYLPETRRRIEAGLREGRIRCVVSTSALELGIDIGTLDAVVCAGYPGSMAALWQRFGRAGRRREPALALLVTSSAALDQYCAQEPRAVVDAPVEQARIDPDNVEILVQHVKCAAFELPFEAGEAFGNVTPEETAEVLDFLAQHELLHVTEGARGGRTYHWMADAYPANHVSLRSVGWDNFVIIDREADRTIAEMDFRATHTMLHEQAIYQHEGEQYQVERLDFDNHKAYVRKVSPDYFTTAMTYTRVEVLEEARVEALASGSGGLTATGEVSVVEKVVGFKKIKFHTHENVGYGEVRLPEMQMHTTAFWLMVPERIVDALPYARPTVIDALRGYGQALHTVAAVGLMTDPRDLGHTLGDRSDPHSPPAKRGGAPGFDPTLFFYDHVPGGVGLSPRLFEARAELMRRARQHALGCVCQDGCPACIGPQLAPTVDPGALAGAVSRKRVLVELLDALGIVLAH